MSNALALCTDSLTDQDQPLDLSQIIKLRYKHNMSYQQIADRIGCHKTSVMRKLDKYISMLPSAEEVESYRENKTQMLTALEYKVYEKMCNEETLKAASFNNLAYGFQNICTQNRLEQGLATERLDIQTVTGTIEELRKKRLEMIADLRPVIDI